MINQLARNLGVIEALTPEMQGRQRAPVEPRRGWYLPYKSVVERLLAFLLLVAATPLLVLIICLVRLRSAGGGIYRQRRLGQFGREYWMYKIRTMYLNSESASGPVWAERNDSRVTPLGQFLRETHLDELPQLWNVVIGEMSLIGPRPERAEIAVRIEESAPAYRQRLRLRPGMTGLAQVELPADRDITDATRKLTFDLYYVREVSPLLDGRIALSTLLHVLSLFADALGKRILRSCRGTIEQSAPSLDEIELPDDIATG